MISVPLRSALDLLAEVFVSDSTLIPTLESDALLARARSGEAKACLPRLLELISTRSFVGAEPFEVFQIIQDFGDWPHHERNAVWGWADAWWVAALADHPGEQPAATVLGELTHLGAPMVRWLDVWRDLLDGPAMLHLVDAILEGEETPAWAASDDERGQLVGWAQSEPVLMGITLIGGVHIPEGKLGEILDLLL